MDSNYKRYTHTYEMPKHQGIAPGGYGYMYICPECGSKVGMPILESGKYATKLELTIECNCVADDLLVEPLTPS